MNRKELLTKFEHSMLVIGKEIHEDQIGISKYSPAQNYVLGIVNAKGTMRVKELAELLRVTSGAVTQHLDVLVKAGLLVRTVNPDNRREVMVDITPEGKRISHSIHRAKSRMINQLFSELDDQEMLTLVTLIEKVSRKYRENKGV